MTENKSSTRSGRRSSKGNPMLKNGIIAAVLIILGMMGYSKYKNYVSPELRKIRKLVAESERFVSRFEPSEVIGKNKKSAGTLNAIRNNLLRINPKHAVEHKAGIELGKKIDTLLVELDVKNAALLAAKHAFLKYTWIWEQYTSGNSNRDQTRAAFEEYVRDYPDSAQIKLIPAKLQILVQDWIDQLSVEMELVNQTVEAHVEEAAFKKALDALAVWAKEVESTPLPDKVLPEVNKLKGMDTTIRAACKAAYKEYAEQVLAGIDDHSPEALDSQLTSRFEQYGLEENRSILEAARNRIAAAVQQKLAALQKRMRGAALLFEERSYGAAVEAYTALLEAAGKDQGLVDSFKEQLWQCELLAAAKQIIVGSITSGQGRYTLAGFGALTAADETGLTVMIEGQTTTFQWKKLGQRDFNKLMLYVAEKKKNGTVAAAYAFLALQAGRDDAADTFIMRAVQWDPSLKSRYGMFITESLARVAARKAARLEEERIRREASAEKLAELKRKQAGLGIAARYPGDRGLEKDPAVLYYLDFDNESKTKSWAGMKAGYGWTEEKENVFAGKGALEIQQTKGTHNPGEIHPRLKETDVAFIRFYRKWSEGYDWTQHKMPGVYAMAPGTPKGGAGVKPNGTDKYSCKLYVNYNGCPMFYSYHPDQKDGYGDGLRPNLGGSIKLKTEQWYCFELMIKANNAPEHDGELKMWLDGKLVGHHQNIRFRDTNDLKINEFTYSAYVGGHWTSQQDQKLWDDQIVVATEYIGPMR